MRVGTGSRAADRRTSEETRCSSPSEDDGSGFPSAIRRDAERRNQYREELWCSAVVAGPPGAGQSPGFGREFSYEWVPASDEAAAVVAPSLVGVKLQVGWAGLYENSPDHNALIGRAQAPRNFLYATGFSGHGFLQAPAVGELVTDLYLERDSFMDPHPFRADRFRDAEALKEVHII